MHILTFILWVIIGSICAAGRGDFSGIQGIFTFIVGGAFFLGFLWVLAFYPWVLFGVFILVLITLYSINKK